MRIKDRHPDFQGDRLTGFVHAEDHYWTQIGAIGFFAPGHEVYKSISLGDDDYDDILLLIPHPPVCSEDLGRSWTRHGQILTVGTRPAIPTWAGIGDFDIVWDWQHQR